MVKSESVTDEKLRQTIQSKANLRFRGRTEDNWSSAYAPNSDYLKRKMKEELDEVLNMEAIVEQKAKLMEEQYIYNIDKGEVLPSMILDTGAASGIASEEDAQ